MASRTLPAGFAARRPGARFYPRISLADGLLGLVRLLLLWQERANERLRLREMDDHMLKDIGISRVDALREGEKPFWRD
ncbi:Uncharacterized conserved protein YjiS, DUF1127 family [Tistlia consotensis]|uniref:Uncharacterized conserved protein YjiS, DUF1127 family n=1 Tax=Tistlia consotensis USBA 355 TaxID=560819 RepID=A0A1Y6BXH3_9PROT|nr:DUF1127 domain-containing protein [Tistlia consotensis]SMF32534.1 Uncharacterized conserved protein YjiS, DUF1127 family [Tistlia consotensis USBA 355]SNR68598.1 Uncharacterized conserved protein YjiS, DUF1127 family [Tistlia consotensis]